MKKLFKALGVALVILILVSVVGLYGTAKMYLGKVERIESEKIDVIAPEHEDFETEKPHKEEVPEPTEAVPDPTEAVPEPTEAVPEPVETAPVEEIQWEDIEALDDDNLINILAVGQDAHPGSDRGRSDTMILFSFNPETSRVSMISFLRDTYVNLPGEYSDNRLNAPYRFGGFPMLYETMRLNFGLSIDGGVEIDFDGFKEVVDILGGVDIYVTEEEAASINRSYYDTLMTAGMSHLDGEKALRYARHRKSDNDFMRTQRQRKVLTILFEKMRDMDLQTAFKLVDKLLGMVRTDLTDEEIGKMAMKIVPILPELELSSFHVPADDAYQLTRRRKMSVLVPDLEKIREDLMTEYLPLER